MTHAPVRWGVLGVANIAVRKVIPAMQRSARTPVLAIASRALQKARAAADQLGIERAYGSYEELLADGDVDAIYNPLPNHEHVPWTLRAAQAGKHVLCEKPIALTATEARTLIAVRDRSGVLIGEAFMVRTHPQWLKARELVDAGRIGELRAVSGHFSYFNRDPHNVRNLVAYGGGALLDIGCYPVTMARFLFGSEPLRVVSLVERDPDFVVDRLTSALLEFGRGHATFTCGTQHVPYQRMQIFGTRGRIEIEIPFNAPADRPCRILVDDGRDVFGGGVEIIEFPVVDQYTVQGDCFAAAIRGQGEVPVPLEDSLANMLVIDAIFRSAKSGSWEQP